MTFTSVFYEKTLSAAKRRLNKLRTSDKFPELKAYIIKEGDEYRVLRKVDLSKKTK